MAPPTHSISIRVELEGRLVDTLSFDRPILNVGKLSTSNLRLDDPNVSRKHAVIERREGGEWRITDLGSTNGTLVNGKRVVQAVLASGDRVELGSATLVIELSERQALPAAPPEAPAQRAEPAPEIAGLGEQSFYSARTEMAADRSDRGMMLEVALLWGETVLSIEHFREPTTIAVGEDRGCRFTVPAEVLGSTAYPLVVPHGEGFALNLENPFVEGDILLEGRVVTVDELRAGRVLPVTDHMRARLRVGEFTLLVSHSPVPPKPKVSPLGAVDYTPHIFVALSAIVHITFLVILSLMPDEQLKSRMDTTARRTKMIEVLKVTAAEEEQEPEELAEPEPEDTKVDPEAEPTDLDGVSTVAEQKPTEKRPPSLINKLIEKRKQQEDALAKLPPAERKAKTREIAVTAGAAGTLSQSTLLSDLLDNETNPLSHDGKRLIALTSKDSAADPFASGGALDPFGGSLNPPGGFISSVGDPDGPGGPDGPVVSGLDKRPSRLDKPDLDVRPAEPVAYVKDPTVRGELDRATVQSIIRRNLGGIRWCYQDALQRNKRLRGKVALSFSILPNGSVSGQRAVNKGGLDDASLLTCISNKVRRLRFPSPKDGGVVKVSYPLILKTQRR